MLRDILSDIIIITNEINKNERLFSKNIFLSTFRKKKQEIIDKAICDKKT